MVRNLPPSTNPTTLETRSRISMVPSDSIHSDQRVTSVEIDLSVGANSCASRPHDLWAFL
jgi:hypothetical protein